MNRILDIIRTFALVAIAVGALWMAHEQRRSNDGIFVPFPTPQTYHVVPTPKAPSF